MIKARAGCQWLIPVILATQEAEIKRITAQGQPRQIVWKTLYQNTQHKKRAGGVAQVVERPPDNREAPSSNSRTVELKKESAKTIDL
jgi:hypothetical protein